MSQSWEPEPETARGGSLREASRRAILVLVGCAFLTTLGLAAVTVVSWAARRHWALDLLTHFPLQIALAGLAMLAVLMGAGRWKLALLPAFVVTVNVAQVLPIYLPREGPSYSGRTYRAVLANVYTGNQERDRFLDFIAREKPDFIVVLEIDGAWARSLEPLDEDYPHSVILPRQDNFGIALLSRAPIARHEIRALSPAGVPTILGSLELDDRELSVIATHPLPPVGGAYSTARNRQLRELGQWAAELPAPQVLLGDLNATPWSPHFTDLLDRTQLRDSRQGFGLQPSWPALPWPMRIPIDHALTSPNIQTVARRLGPDIGSDHRPVVIEFRLPAQGRPRDSSTSTFR